MKYDEEYRAVYKDGKQVGLWDRLTCILERIKDPELLELYKRASSGGLGELTESDDDFELEPSTAGAFECVLIRCGYHLQSAESSHNHSKDAGYQIQPYERQSRA